MTADSTLLNYANSFILEVEVLRFMECEYVFTIFFFILDIFHHARQTLAFDLNVTHFSIPNTAHDVLLCILTFGKNHTKGLFTVEIYDNFSDIASHIKSILLLAFLLYVGKQLKILYLFFLEVFVFIN